MSSREQEYAFAPLNEDPELVRRIRRFETDLAEEYGEPVTLIAYVKKQDEPDAACRAGLDD